MKYKNKKLILASGSPRRIELLKMLGCKFEIVPSKIEEKISPRLSPIENVKRLSCLKALDVASKISDGIVIAADTDVVLNGKILGKPKNKKEAREMLKKLSGKEHQVITGLAVVDAKSKRILQDIVITVVKFRKFDKNLIEKYIASGEPLDKAGAYGIQGKGALLVESIKGDYFNVVGLPLNALNQLLEKFGINLI
jgi:septum formation protein